MNSNSEAIGQTVAMEWGELEDKKAAERVLAIE